MSINTIANAARNNQMPYVDENNTLQGECNPLKMFFCPSGLALDAGTPANSRLTSAVGGMYVEKSDLALANGLITGNINAQLLKTSDDSNYTHGNVLASTDVLLVLSGQVRGGTMSFGIVGDSATFPAQLTLSGGGTSGAGRSQISDSYATDSASGALTQVLLKDYAAVMASDLRDTNTDVNGRLYSLITDGSLAINSDTAKTLVNTYGDLPFTAVTKINFGTLFYAAAYFEFPNESLPSDWKVQSLMMAEQWRLGNYVVPEGWATL